MTLFSTPRGRIAEALDALPAPLFASLAALALVGGGERPTVPALLVAAATLLDTIRRSLALAVVCGIAGFLLGQALPV